MRPKGATLHFLESTAVSVYRRHALHAVSDADRVEMKMRKLYEHIAETSTEDLLVILQFFEHPRLRQHFTGLIADIRNVLKKRGHTTP